MIYQCYYEFYTDLGVYYDIFFDPDFSDSDYTSDTF